MTALGAVETGAEVEAEGEAEAKEKAAGLLTAWLSKLPRLPKLRFGSTFGNKEMSPPSGFEADKELVGPVLAELEEEEEEEEEDEEGAKVDSIA